jgi:hypothetical protein
VKSSSKFIEDARLPSRRKISSNSILRLQKEVQNLSIEKVVSDIIRTLKRNKDPSSKERLNVIKNSQKNQSITSKFSRKQISKKSSENIYSPNKLFKAKAAASVSKKLKNAQRIFFPNSSDRQQRKPASKNPY